MIRIFSLLVLACLLMSGGPDSFSEYAPIHFKVVKLSNGVFACIHREGGRAIGNAGIIDNGEATIIFDSFLSPAATKELISLVGQMKLSPITYVVNSHAHSDHIRGNQCFDADVKIFSTQACAANMAADEAKSIAEEIEYGAQQYQYYDSLSKAFQGNKESKEYHRIQQMMPYYDELAKSYRTIKTRVPDNVVHGEKNLDGSKHKVRLIEKGKGHTNGDLILYLPDEGILFSGDLVFNQTHPYLGDGYLSEWKQCLKDMQGMKIESLVPGHGNVCGKEGISGMQEYIRNLEGLCRNAKQESDLEKITIPAAYENWPLEDFFVGNLKKIYKEK